jgi:hypothetical protein
VNDAGSSSVCVLAPCSANRPYSRPRSLNVVGNPRVSRIHRNRERDDDDYKDDSGGTYTAQNTNVAAEFSGYAGKFRDRLRRKEFQQFVPILGSSKRALKLTRSVCLRARALDLASRSWRYSPAPPQVKSARMVPPAATTPKVTCSANTTPGFDALHSRSKTRKARCTLAAENPNAPRIPDGWVSDTGRRRPWAETGENNDRHMDSHYLLLI